MPLSEAPFDLSRAQRWFAVEFNNEAWDLLELVDRTPQQDELMVHSAHAAARHWTDAGTAINRLRALCLLSCAHYAIGDAFNALRYGQQCEQISSAGCEGQNDFDRATALASLARAQRLADDDVAAINSMRHALDVAVQLDEEERTIFERFFTFAD
jgi:hypothetical protein